MHTLTPCTTLIAIRCLKAASLLALVAWPPIAGAETAAVTATVVTDAGNAETEFVLEMEGRQVRLLHGGTATDRHVAPAHYHISLVPVRGFRLTDIVCLGDEGRRLPADVTLDNQSIVFEPGADRFINCVFRLEAGMATVRATVLTDARNTESAFTLQMEGVSKQLAQGETATDRNAAATTYHMALLPTPGFRLVDIVCRDADSNRLSAEVAHENRSIAFSPGIGGNVHCRFRLQAETATVTAMVLTDDARVDDEFTLEMAGERVPLQQGTMATDRRAAADIYHMALLPVQGFRLLDIACHDNDNKRLSATIDAENQSIAFAPGTGGFVSCVFRLQSAIANVTATVLTDSADTETEFTVEMQGEPFPVLHGGTATDRRARADLYRIALLQDRHYRLTDFVCLTGEGRRLPAEVTFENQSIAFAPGRGAFVNCIIRLENLPAEDPVSIAAAPPAPTAGGDCCSCQTAGADLIRQADMLPCVFKLPPGWEARSGDDGAAVSVVADAGCDGGCPVSPALAFSVARKPNRNAESMEEIWPLGMKVVGHASCGGRAVTFFETPGSEPGGQVGGLRFHVGFGGDAYGSSATFTCPAAGEWMQIRDLFIDSFRTNPNSSFGDR